MGRIYASFTLSYSWEGFMRNTPPDLCKLYLELLMGRIYAKHTTSYSWGGNMQNVFCINPSHEDRVKVVYYEGFMQNTFCIFPPHE